jgi:hypothetical protein
MVPAYLYRDTIKLAGCKTLKVSASPEAAQGRHWLSMRMKRRLLLVLTITLLALAFTVSRGTGNGKCAAPRVRLLVPCARRHSAGPLPRPGSAVAWPCHCAPTGSPRARWLLCQGSRVGTGNRQFRRVTRREAWH